MNYKMIYIYVTLIALKCMQYVFITRNVTILNIRNLTFLKVLYTVLRTQNLLFNYARTLIQFV